VGCFGTWSFKATFVLKQNSHVSSCHIGEIFMIRGTRLLMLLHCALLAIKRISAIHIGSCRYIIYLIM